MGISNRLHDVSGDSIPLILIALAAAWISYLRSLLLRLLFPSSPTSGDLFAPVGSGLAGLVVLADHLASHPAFPFHCEDGGDERRRPDCVFCLAAIGDGDRVRRLSCSHVFHAECLDGWFDRMNLSCPLCRSPPGTAVDGRDRRIGADLVTWLSGY
ncbi:E3 ubiquitin-protein ligase RHA2A-like [Typha latifolia]|uniref:E3 ubiquitin-protein ligase RHA2A-like n=1 Tax=Typha latifolia TaxID=4733 RepID=UPI003C2DA770